MKLQNISTGYHGVKQFTFRVNRDEIDALLTAIEITHSITPSAPASPPLKEVRRYTNIARKELRRAIKELEEERSGEGETKQ